MKLAVGTALFFLGFAQFSWGQTNGSANLVSGDSSAPTPSPNNYVVFGASPQQEALVRAQIQIMQPAVLPLRVFFVPHWKYVEDTRIFHLPSRTVFIDADRYIDESLGYWLAHELGHLATSSSREDDAEKAAHEYRKRLKQAHIEMR